MTRKTIMLLAIVVLLNNSKELIILMTVKFLSQVKLSVISRNKHKSKTWLVNNMSLFDNIKTFAAAWNCTKEEKAPESFAQQIKSCVAQTSHFTGSDGLPASNFQLVCTLVDGGHSYLTLDKSTLLSENQTVDPKSIVARVYSKQGETDIVRFDGKKL